MDTMKLKGPDPRADASVEVALRASEREIVKERRWAEISESEDEDDPDMDEDDKKYRKLATDLLNAAHRMTDVVRTLSAHRALDEAQLVPLYLQPAPRG